MDNDIVSQQFKRESYIQEKMQGVDLGTMSGRIRYYRLKKGISQLEMGRRIGMGDCKSYAKTYEDLERSTINLEAVRKICQVREIDEDLIFDPYMKFISGDYRQQLRDLREAMGKTRGEMDRLMGNSRGLYRKWEQGRQVPSRKMVEKVLRLMEEV